MYAVPRKSSAMGKCIVRTATVCDSPYYLLFPLTLSQAEELTVFIKEWKTKPHLGKHSRGPLSNVCRRTQYLFSKEMSCTSKYLCLFRHVVVSGIVEMTFNQRVPTSWNFRLTTLT